MGLDHFPPPIRRAYAGRRTLVLVVALAIVNLTLALAPAITSATAGHLGVSATSRGTSSHGIASTPTIHRASHSTPPFHSSPAGSPAPQCDGVLWSSTVWASYSPSYCYGHDEPTTSYVSTAPGSGADASFRMTLPADGVARSQGDFYATIWFGGTVYDVQSLDTQAFLEFQFYPAAPFYTGPASGAKDCGPDGSFYPNFVAGSNKWFACVIVWQITGGIEDAAYAGPLNSGGTSAILEMYSGDTIYVNYTGVAKSLSQGWQISAADTTLGSGGSVTLKNGSLVLSPYYATAAPGDTLLWGASNPGAISFAYEIGHGLNPIVPVDNGAFGCNPGEASCFSYWPGEWAKAGQMDLELPVMGQPGSHTYPSKVVFSSSQGGENEVNTTLACGHPNTSTLTNCMYPWIQYRSGFYGFTYGTSTEPNATYEYGGEYQFPATLNGAGQWNGNSQTAPWGTFATTVSPLNATANFNRNASTNRLALASNGSGGGQYEEGPYWLNVTSPGCTPISTFIYVRTGSSHNIPGKLSCNGAPPLSASETPSGTLGTAPFNVSFTGSGSGGNPGYTYNWTFGDGGSSVLQNPYHVYMAAGTYTALLKVKDLNGDTAGASSQITVSGVLRAIASANVTSGPTNLTVQFTGSAAGGTPTYSYAWKFGDGTTSPLQNPTHTYTAVGAFTAQLNVTDSAAHYALISVPIHTSLESSYAVWFNETGLSAGTSWTVNVSGSPKSTTGASLAFSLHNGSHAYLVTVSNSSFRPLAANGHLSVTAADASVGVSFVRWNYTVTFRETTLPTGLSWTVLLAGGTNSTTSDNVTFRATNGTYPYRVTAPPGYAATPSSGLASVSGANASTTIGFATVKFVVAFKQTDLPAGTSWNATFNGQRQASTSVWDNFSAPDGVYAYSVSSSPIWSATPGSGMVTVNLANQTIHLAFSPVTYMVAFDESGLPNGTSWSVLVSGVYVNGTTSSLGIGLQNGSHVYSATAGAGYTVKNGSGTLEISGQPRTVSIQFAAAPHPPPSSSPISGFFTSTTFYLALAALVVVVAGAVIYAIGARRRRTPPGSS